MENWIVKFTLCALYKSNWLVYLHGRVSPGSSGTLSSAEDTDSITVSCMLASIQDRDA